MFPPGRVRPVSRLWICCCPEPPTRFKVIPLNRVKSAVTGLICVSKQERILLCRFRHRGVNAPAPKQTEPLGAVKSSAGFSGPAERICLRSPLGRWSKKPAYSWLPAETTADRPTFVLFMKTLDYASLEKWIYYSPRVSFGYNSFPANSSGGGFECEFLDVCVTYETIDVYT